MTDVHNARRVLLHLVWLVPYTWSDWSPIPGLAGPLYQVPYTWSGWSPIPGLTGPLYLV